MTYPTATNGRRRSMRGSGSNEHSGVTQGPTGLVSRCLTPPQPVRPEKASGTPLSVSGVSLVSVSLQINSRTFRRQEEGVSAAVSRPLRQVRQAHEQTAFVLRQCWDPRGAAETRAALPAQPTSNRYTLQRPTLRRLQAKTTNGSNSARGRRRQRDPPEILDATSSKRPTASGTTEMVGVTSDE